MIDLISINATERDGQILLHISALRNMRSTGRITEHVATLLLLDLLCVLLKRGTLSGLLQHHLGGDEMRVAMRAAQHRKSHERSDAAVAASLEASGL